MPTEVIIITPEATPGAGGVADYTLRVVSEWGDVCRLRFLVPNSVGDGTEELGQNAAALLNNLPTKGGRVLLQYSGYGFNKINYPRWLLRALADWKRKSGGLLVVMLHEIWTFWPWWNKNYFVQLFHRRGLGKLVRSADVTFTSTAFHAEQLRRLAPAKQIEVLPVGSNIRPQNSHGAKTLGAAVLFGLQGSRVRTLRRLRPELKSLAAAQRIRKLVTAGGRNFHDADERDLLTGLQLVDGFEQHGALPEEAISELLSHASFGVSAQEAVSVTKSGAFMAYAAHGLNIISPFASPAEEPPLRWGTHPDELLQGISDEELSERGEKLRDWQEHACSWPHIAERFASALQLGN